MNAYMSAPGRQHKEVRPWLGANLQCISQHTLSQLINQLCQPNQTMLNEKILKEHFAAKIYGNLV